MKINNSRKAGAISLTLSSWKELGWVKSRWVSYELRVSLFISLCFILVYAYIFDAKLDLGGDNFDYLNYASSILNGRGYASPCQPDYPPTNWYPPAYSMILSVLLFCLGKNIFFLKVFNGMFFLGTILVLHFAAIKLNVDRKLSLWVSILLLLNAGLLKYSTILMSEMPYLFFTSLAFHFIVRLSSESSNTPLLKDLLLASLFAALAYYTRGAGIALAVAFVLGFGIQKQFKKIGVFIVVFGLLYSPWIIRNNLHGFQDRYVKTIFVKNAWRPEAGKINTLSEFTKKIKINLVEIVVGGVPQVVFPFYNYKKVRFSTACVLSIFILIVSFYGCIKLGKIRYFLIFYLLASLGILLLWHSGNEARYVWPLSPFLTLLFFYGLHQLLYPIMSKRKSFAYFHYVLIIPCLLSFSKINKLNKYASMEMPPGFRNYFQLAEFAKRNNLSHSTFIARKPGMFHFYSGAFVYNYLYDLDDTKVIEHMIEKNVEYVVLDQLGYSSTARYLYPAIKKNEELFRVVQVIKKPDTYLLKFDLKRARSVYRLSE